MTVRHSLPAALFLTMALSAGPAYAARSELCQQLATVPPVSQHYTQKVLERADKGIQRALQAQQNTDFDRYRGNWALQVASGWAALIDSSLSLTREEEELPHVSACLQFDVLAIDCKMDEVRDELRAQIERGSFLAIRRLLEVLAFLQERKKHLRAGALDPLYEDPTWGTQYGFDTTDAVWCCPQSIPGNTCEQIPSDTCTNGGGTAFATLNECSTWGCTVPPDQLHNNTAMCPFNADYAPPYQNGFGCDIDVMEPRAAYAPLQSELEALSIIQQQVQAYQSGALAFIDIQRRLDALFGNASSASQPLQQRTHLNAFGCGWSTKYCSDATAQSCTTDSDCSQGVQCVLPDKVCTNNRAVRCQKDAHCGGSGPCIDAVQLPALHELRGPFSVDKNHVTILSDFLGERVAQEISRSFVNDLKTPNEFGTAEAQKRSEREFQERNPFLRMFRSSLRLERQLWSRLQARNETRIYPEAVDAPLEIAESLTSLRSAVQTLSRLASHKDGARQFVARYAYFLKRSCVYRPCNSMLEQVIRIVTTDACFPYTNGEYLADTPQNPRWQQCKGAAGIE